MHEEGKVTSKRKKAGLKGKRERRMEKKRSWHVRRTQLKTRSVTASDHWVGWKSAGGSVKVKETRSIGHSNKRKKKRKPDKWEGRARSGNNGKRRKC